MQKEKFLHKSVKKCFLQDHAASRIEMIKTSDAQRRELKI